MNCLLLRHKGGKRLVPSRCRNCGPKCCSKHAASTWERDGAFVILKNSSGQGCDGCECEQLKQEIAGWKESLHKYEIEYEVKQSFTDHEMACLLVESNVKAINNHYKIPG